MNAIKKILVVDDEPLNINILVELLKDTYKMMAAKSGVQALKAARSSNKPDLILLDIMMPEMDGYEVCRQLKADESTKDIPVIFVSAMSETLDETKGFDVGAIDYITKPISPKTLGSKGTDPSCINPAGFRIERGTCTHSTTAAAYAK